MINLLIIKNPAKPFEDYVTKQVSYIPGKPVFHYVQDAILLPQDEIEIIHNREPLTVAEFQSVIPGPNDIIAVMPKIAGGDDNEGLRVVAAIIIMYFAWWAGGAATSALQAAGYSAGAAGFWGGMVAVGLQYAGGQLVNEILPPPKPEKDNFSPSYGWNIQPQTNPGGAVAINLGEVRTAGYIIDEHITFDGSKQYYNVLIEAGEGPCDYTGNGEDANCTGITDIKINDVPIESISDLTLEVYKRAGLNDQSAIPNFNDTFNEKGLSFELKEETGWVMATTNSNAQGLELVFSCPAGLLIRDNDGDTHQNTVRLEAEYQKQGDAEWTRIEEAAYVYASKNSDTSFEISGDYSSQISVGEHIEIITRDYTVAATVLDVIVGTEIIGEDNDEYQYTIVTVDQYVSSKIRSVKHLVDYIAITAKTQTALYKTVRKDNIGDDGLYNVRVRCIARGGSDNNDIRTVYWTGLSGITYDDFIRPNKCLLAIKALANDHFSGSRPIITFTVKRSNVLVWVPNTLTDPEGAGSYQLKPATNPAWATWWACHRVYHLKNINTGEFEYLAKGVPKQYFNYVEFSDWAAACDAANLTVNLRIETTQKLIEALPYLTEMGRGKIVMRGTSIGCMFDAPWTGEYEQMFTDSNIILNSFKEHYTNTKNRVTGLEIKYRDKDANYDWITLFVPADGLTDYEAHKNITKIELRGCNNRQQAWDYGKYQLRVNRLISCTAEWSADIDAIECRAGSVVSVQRSKAKWGKGGGRVVSVADNLITLNRKVTIEAGETYRIRVRMGDNSQIVKTVQGYAETTETDILPLTEPFTEDTVDVLDRIDGTHLTVAGDLTAKILPGKGLVLNHDYVKTSVTTIVSAVYNEQANQTLIEVTDLIPESTYSIRYDFTMPKPGDMWEFGLVGLESKPFRVVRFERDKDLKCKIYGTEYQEAVYDQTGTAPVIEYGPVGGIETISILANEYKDTAGTWLVLSWKAPKNYYRAVVKYDGQQVGEAPKSETSFVIGIDGGDTGTEHVILVEIYNALGVQIASGSMPYVIQGGLDRPPAAPAGLSFNWDTPDLKIWWDTVGASDNGIVTEDVKDYKIEIFVGGVLKRTEYSAGNLYTYTLPKNITDNTNPVSAVTVAVYARDYREQLSAVSEIVCDCPNPTAPTITATGAVAAISLSVGLSLAQQTKFSKFQVKASQSVNFDPDNQGELIHDNPSPVYTHKVDSGTTWYYRARIIDKLGQASPWSEQVSATADKVSEADMMPQILLQEVTANPMPTSGTLANMQDGVSSTSATFGAATTITQKFVGEHNFSTLRINTTGAVNVYSQYFDEQAQIWKDWIGSAASPVSVTAGGQIFNAGPGTNYPYVTARQMRLITLAACSIAELRFGTIGQIDDLYAEKIKAGMIEAGSMRIGQEVAAPNTAITINPATDHLFHFDGSLASTQRVEPLSGAVVTMRPNEGRFGGCVAIEAATENKLITTGYLSWFAALNIGDSSDRSIGGGIIRITRLGEHRYRAEVTQDTTYPILTLGANWLWPANQPHTISAYILDYYEAPGTQGRFGLGRSSFGTTSLHGKDGLGRKTATLQDTTEITSSIALRSGNNIVTAGTYIEWEFAQVELNKPYATSFVNGTRAAGALQYPQLLDKNEGTMSVWIKPNYVTNYNNYFNMAVSTGRFLLFFNSNGQSRWDFGAANSGAITANGAVAAGRWDMHTLAWSASAGTYSYYLNGQLVGTRPFVAPDSLPSALPTVSNQYSSLFDELLILPRAATPDEIKLWYSTSAPFYDPTETVTNERLAPIDAGKVPISGGNGSVTIDSTGLKTFNGSNLQCSIGTDGRFLAGGGAVVADEEGLHGFDPQNGYVKTFDITPRGEIKDKDGYQIIDVNGKFNGKTVLSGVITVDEPTTPINMSNVVVPPGKKWVAVVSPLADMDIPAATTGKVVKWLWHSIGLSFQFTTSNPHVLPAGNYGNLQFFVNHYAMAMYSYTDSTGDSKDNYFDVYFEIREINA